MTDQDHIDQIMAVMAEAFDPAFGEAWNRRQLEDALLIGNCHYLLIAADGEEPGPGEVAAGFTLSRHGFEEEELLLFAVAPAHRGQGLGQTLLARFASTAQARGALRLLLEMREDNSAGRLYRKFGFAAIGRRPSYYRTPLGTRLDAITFACDCEMFATEAQDRQTGQ
jgi:[ribosomal protein S18]-alanine N-acetyltransferase